MNKNDVTSALLPALAIAGTATAAIFAFNHFKTKYSAKLNSVLEAIKKDLHPSAKAPEEPKQKEAN